jgi:hypothetical protein
MAEFHVQIIVVGLSLLVVTVKLYMYHLLLNTENLIFPTQCICALRIIPANKISIAVSVSRDSAVGTAPGYRLDDRGVGVRVPVGIRIFSSSRRPDRLWGPPSLLPNGYRRFHPWG